MSGETRPEVAALLLAGGFGTRIRRLVPDVPKPMIPVSGKPFIEWIIRHLRAQGIGEFVLSTGHLAEKVAAYFEGQPVPDTHVKCLAESEPLGTAGAILYNLHSLPASCTWVLAANGDSLVRFDIDAMTDKARDEVEGVILALEQTDCSRFGKLTVSPDGRLLGFEEKSPGPGLINAGVYLLRRGVLEAQEKRKPLSIEKDYFPERLAAGAVFKVVRTPGPFLDIGTPETLATAETWLSRASDWLEGTPEQRRAAAEMGCNPFEIKTLTYVSEPKGFKFVGGENAEAFDYAIVGAGIIGLSIARELKRRLPEASICILDKEPRPAMHASGRNSGVLHAGFYYTADSLKARFTREGNQAMNAYCREQGIPLNECGKLVVAQTEADLDGLRELKARGDNNGVDLRWISEKEARELEPNVRTVEAALHSPATASVDPALVCAAIAKELTDAGVLFLLGTEFRDYKYPTLITSQGPIRAEYVINCAGLYADRIAHRMGAGLQYVMMPFKGVYLKWGGDAPPVRMHIYPVPNLQTPFLGVHFTVTADGHVKIGPTAIPAFWREHYGGLSRFRLGEALQVLRYESVLFLKNSFGFRTLAMEEMRKYRKGYLANCAARLVQEIDPAGFREWGTPAIRAQLMHRRTLKLEQDFIVEEAEHSLHVLNAVSPAFTCALPIAKYVVDRLTGVPRQATDASS